MYPESEWAGRDDWKWKDSGRAAFGGNAHDRSYPLIKQLPAPFLSMDIRHQTPAILIGGSILLENK